MNKTETYQALSFPDALQSLPPEWPVSLQPDIWRDLHASSRSIVVLDDDPTGTQTVHDVPVFTSWTSEVFRRAFSERLPVFYVLTNSRALPLEEAVLLGRTIGRHLQNASEATGRQFTVISRSDSTLRGHYPAEVEALQAGLGTEGGLQFIIPAFFEGGRYTLNDVHYVREQQQLIPAAQTHFAADPYFGYRHSHLPDWIREKFGNGLAADRIRSISLDELRQKGPDSVRRSILRFSDQAIVIVNAASYRDLEVFSLGLRQSGRSAVLRTAASFVKAFCGIPERALITAGDCRPNPNGILIVVGSYVDRSTRQLQHLLEKTDVLPLELSVDAVLQTLNRALLLRNMAEQIDAALGSGKDVVLYTSRHLIAGKNKEESLQIGKSVSHILSGIINRLTAEPRLLIAKGGITSSDLATAGLGVEKAMIRGQILPGIPIWELGRESKFPGLPYIVFPGNVGQEEDLTAIFQQWKDAHE